MASARIADHIGRVLGGRYRLLTPIGTGASAHVFLADDSRLQRRVAVKVLHPALAEDAAFLRRFRAEATAAAALNHPHIVAVYDWGEEGDGPFIVTEFLAGGSLRAMLDRGRPLSASQTLMIGLEAARALDYAHRRGLIHRDIKPANLLFDAEGHLRVADFGLARALAEAAWTEPAGAVLGTARYAAPEQVQGVALDGKADIYSLAIVLVEAATGEVPFAAETTIGTLMGRLGKPLDVPPSLGALAGPLYRAGQPDAADRPDALVFASLLQEAAPRLPAPQPLPLAGPAAFDGTQLVLDQDPTDVGANASAASATTVVDLPMVVPGGGSAPPPPPTTGQGSKRRHERPPKQPKQPKQPRARGRRRRWPWVVLTLLLVMAGGAGGGYAITRARVPEHLVPRVQDLQESEAEAALKPLKFEIRTERPFVNGTTLGQVVSQLPAAGTKLKEGKAVVITVSQGPQPVPVPDLAGLDQDAATKAIEAAGLTRGEVTERFDETVAAGGVLEFAPPKGVPHPTGSAVAMVVSKGPEPRQVPTLAGRTFDQAKAALEAVGLQAARVDAYNNDVPRGQVVSTAPAAGGQAERGSTATLTVSRGQPEVPNLSGMTREQANVAVQGVELKLGNVYGPTGGKVFIQQPVAGTTARLNSNVDIFIM